MTMLVAAHTGIAYNHSMVGMGEILRLLKTVTLFAGMTDSELNALAKDFTRLEFGAEEVIFYQGDAGHTLYLVENGKVRIYVQNEDGQELSVNVCGRGDLFGEMSVIDELPRSASAAAMEPATVLRLSRERFREHLRRSPQLGINFMKALSVRIRFSTRQLDNLTLTSVPTRLARKLLELAQQHGVPELRGVRLEMPLTQTQLASLLGTTRESVNKAVSQFRRQGVIAMEDGQIIIIDPDALRSLGQMRS